MVKFIKVTAMRFSERSKTSLSEPACGSVSTIIRCSRTSLSHQYTEQLVPIYGVEHLILPKAPRGAHTRKERFPILLVHIIVGEWRGTLEEEI